MRVDNCILCGVKFDQNPNGNRKYCPECKSIRWRNYMRNYKRLHRKSYGIPMEYRVLNNLDSLMYQKQATNISLGEKAGVSSGTVQRARNGDRLRYYIADAIEEALAKFKFEYKPEYRVRK